MHVSVHTEVGLKVGFGDTVGEGVWPTTVGSIVGSGDGGMHGVGDSS